MHKDTSILKNKNNTFNWITIKEAIAIASNIKIKEITDSDIYRHALSGIITLSIYFQSPIFLRKIKTLNNKPILKKMESSFIDQLCLGDIKSLLVGENLIVSTCGEYITTNQRVIDTTLAGYEYVIVQQLLARSLKIPSPITGANEVNYGISITLSGEIFQIFERTTWKERMKQQMMLLPEDVAQTICDRLSLQDMSNIHNKEYFPLYDLPQDACLVIRWSELDRIINEFDTKKMNTLPPTRISTPLSRLLWLACKHNDTIGPLISQPYKLLSIFEQWALAEGITDRLSGDTLKTALERGSPTST